MVAWKITTKFDNVQHLFHNKIKSNYLLDGYNCSCGHIDFVIKYEKQNVISYICPSCENTLFYDANSAWENISYFLEQNKNIKLEYIYDSCIKKDNLEASYITLIPSDINFLENKILFSKKKICKVSISNDGEIKESFDLKYNKKILIKLRQILKACINDNAEYLGIPIPEYRDLSLNMATFFLKNKHLKSFDFYFWKDISQFNKNQCIDIIQAINKVSNYRNEKSVKKAIYKNYCYQLEEYESFNSLFIEIFTEKISDPNLLTKLLEYDFYQININNYKERISNLIDFLKCYYEEKQIVKLFQELIYNADIHILFFDILDKFEYVYNLISKEFIKKQLKIKILHDQVVNIRYGNYKDIYDEKLYYEKDKMISCLNINNYEVKLPRNGQELVSWAEKLNNCMAEYFYMIQKCQTVIYGFFKNNILKFVAEVCDNELIQASGKYNNILTEEENKILEEWMKKFYIN
jgi:hypothetical protein